MLEGRPNQMQMAAEQVCDTRSPAARLPGAPSQVTPPDRRPGSLRRTVVMQSLWPGGPAGGIHIVGTARDLWTGEAIAQAIDEDRIDVMLTPDKIIDSISATHNDIAMAAFSGIRPGGPVRKAMAQLMPDEVAGATLSHRLLDDLGGTSFMATCAWYDWLPGGFDEYEAAVGASAMLHRSVEGLCISFQPGSYAMTAAGRTNHTFSSHPEAPLPFRSDDPLAWHDFQDDGGPNHWRIRYTDIWFDGPVLRVAAAFQDSAALHDRHDRRLLFHEYVLEAVVDPRDYVLVDVSVTAGSLPFATCLAAPPTARALIGRRLTEFSTLAPAVLAKTAGCTHLNEVLRNLHDVPAMAAKLARIQEQTPTFYNKERVI